MSKEFKFDWLHFDHVAIFVGKTRVFRTQDALLGLCDGSLNFIDLSTGEVLHSLGDEDDEITCYALSNSNTSILTSCQSGLFKLYSVEFNTSSQTNNVVTVKKITVSQVAKFRGHTAVSDLVFSADDSLVATSSSTRTVRVRGLPCFMTLYSRRIQVCLCVSVAWLPVCSSYANISVSPHQIPCTFYNYFKL